MNSFITNRLGAAEVTKRDATTSQKVSPSWNTHVTNETRPSRGGYECIISVSSDERERGLITEPLVDISESRDRYDVRWGTWGSVAPGFIHWPIIISHRPRSTCTCCVSRYVSRVVNNDLKGLMRNYLSVQLIIYEHFRAGVAQYWWTNLPLSNTQQTPIQAHLCVNFLNCYIS